MTPFYIPISTWYEVSYLYQPLEFVISNSYLHRSYLHPLHDQFGWSLQEIAEFAHQLLLWTCRLIPFFIGLLITFLNISNIFIRVHIIVGFATNSNIKAMIIISGSLYIYIYIYISNILTNMQYPMHAIHILMHFKHKLRKCSSNQQDRV